MTSAPDPPSPWDKLGIARTNNLTEIRNAYTTRLKSIDTANDPAAFQALRQAYGAAVALATGMGGPAPASPPAPAVVDVAAPTQSPEAAGDTANAWLADFAALGRAGKVSEAMAVIDRSGAVEATSVEAQASLQALLFGAVMDAPEMPPALLAALARRFRWDHAGSALELHRPDLYDRFLQRMGSTPSRPDRRLAIIIFTIALAVLLGFVAAVIYSQ